jgi:hypothetical protein
MIFVTAATGARHRALAEKLDQSFERWGWPRLRVLSPDPLAVREWVRASDDFGRGRGLKVRWAIALPGEYAGPCGWIDADCEATGSWLAPPPPPAGHVAGLLGVKVLANPPFLLFRSTALLSGDAATAAILCAEWARAFAAQPGRACDDEPSLLRAIRRLRLPQVALPGTSPQPFPNLIHHGATNSAAGQITANQPK